MRIKIDTSKRFCRERRVWPTKRGRSKNQASIIDVFLEVPIGHLETGNRVKKCVSGEEKDVNSFCPFNAAV